MSDGSNLCDPGQVSQGIKSFFSWFMYDLIKAARWTQVLRMASFLVLGSIGLVSIAEAEYHL